MTDKAKTLSEEDTALRLFVILNRAQEAVRKATIKDVKKHGLNLSEFAVLELLYNKGEQPIQLIGKKVLLASSSITYVVDKLEKKGYLTREACAKDRRVIYGNITDKGTALMAEIFPKHKEALAHILSGLSHEEKETAIVLLKKLGLFADTL